jgi:hypothetical protein
MTTKMTTWKTTPDETPDEKPDQNPDDNIDENPDDNQDASKKTTPADNLDDNPESFSLLSGVVILVVSRISSTVVFWVFIYCCLLGFHLLLSSGLSSRFVIRYDTVPMVLIYGKPYSLIVLGSLIMQQHFLASAYPTVATGQQPFVKYFYTRQVEFEVQYLELLLFNLVNFR